MRPQKWQHSHLLTDGGVFYEELLDAIGGAETSVDFEYYIFSNDALGDRFVSALTSAAQRGVQVRVLIDGIGSAPSGPEIASRLNRGGVDVKIYHPAPWLSAGYRWSLVRGDWLYKFFLFALNINRRNHRKLCVVDGSKAWVGSLNISAEHLPAAAGGAGWRDYAVALRGEGVHFLQRGFEMQWLSRPARLQRGFLAQHLSNRSRRARRLKNRFVTSSVATARSRVWVVNAYFAPTARLRRALLRACRAGADVRLLLPESSDVRFFPSLSNHYYSELLRAGARIFLYRANVLHAKALLIDDFFILGSSNLNYRSTLHDLELDVVVDDAVTVVKLEAVIAGDCATAEELEQERLPPPTLGSWFWYALRYWM
ncbi:MAG: phospholipase D-like domain-containing protein [Gammaproteobacteria bacterium]|nr:phospholipase D-like domain-containing protein [Gammaproteobacteria bacterium]